MQRMVSTRLDEAVIEALERVTRKLRIPKRQFIEDAIRVRVRELAGADAADPWQATLGAWSRRESAVSTVRASRAAFRHSFERHHKP
jgi:hypothetical protein